ncbi:hypothetical protein [Pseudophaeobacter sp.]|uniref:DUF6902 family protein n=1 Tax=Pseudophaeobacter sp. TaxID=1971739 RepID=UPI00329A70F5
MAKILQFPKGTLPQSRAVGLSRLITTFASQRRAQEDVFWLKENAELLNIFESSGCAREELTCLDPVALEPLRGFYHGADRHLCFFRQYYRFVLSICMDLEDLGLVLQNGRNTASLPSEALAQWVKDQGLADHELSDLQRAEARRLLARRGVTLDVPGLDARLHGFMESTAQFSIPNRKAAFELTHIVFYLSDYGRRDPGLSAGAIQSLTHVGLLAFLDRDADLLSEICVALRFGGRQPSRIWERWLKAHHQGFTLFAGDDAAAPALQQDDYHMFLVSNWYQALSGEIAFQKPVPKGGVRFQRSGHAGILHGLSQAVFQLGTKAADWQWLRPQIFARLSTADAEFLTEVEQSSSEFAAFFEGFARLGRVSSTVKQVEWA